MAHPRAQTRRDVKNACERGQQYAPTLDEARVAMEEIHRRLPDYEVDEAGVTVVHAGNVAGLATLPIRFARSCPTNAAR